MRIGIRAGPLSYTNPYYRLFLDHLRRKGVELVPVGMFWSARRYVDEHIDIVDLQWRDRTLEARIPALQRMGVKVCWTVHNNRPHGIDGRPFSDFARTARLADALVVLSERQKVDLIASYRLEASASKIAVVPHASYIGVYPDGSSRAQSRRRLGIPEDKFVYLSFGRLLRYKGTAELAEIFKQVRGPDDLLIVAGPLRSLTVGIRLSLTADRSIRFSFRKIPDAEVQHYFNAADVCVLPFRQITNSGSLILAMSMKKPVICMVRGSIGEIVNPSFSIGCHDDNDLRRALVDIKTMDLREMGAAAFDAASKTSWDDTADRYLAVYRRILD